MGDLRHSVSAVIFDLDGTLLNTEQVTKNIMMEFLAKYGKVPDKEKEEKRLGMTQKESATAIVLDYDLPLTPDEFKQEILPMYQGMWLRATALPGANRLLAHLYNHGVPFALASNSIRKNIDSKISLQDGWKEYFTVILGSDQVKAGKPSPDIFLEAAKRMGIDPVHCLVIEDSIIGVRAAKAAGMKVVAVPSLQVERDQYSIADFVLHSLLEFQPELWGLPPFRDRVSGSLPIEPIYLKGLYSNGLLQEYADDGLFALPDQIFGIYFGWAKIDADEIAKVVISIGWGPGGCTSKRKIQACLLDESSEHVFDCMMQLLILGYIRGPCTKGKNLEIVDEDKFIVSASLDLPEFSCDLCSHFSVEVPVRDNFAPF